MIDNTLPLDGNLGGETFASDAPAFYVVSRKKLAVLYLTTLGLYSTYWFYKNWSNYKHHVSGRVDAERSLWPVARAVFSIFFIHSLFRKIKARGRYAPEVAAWRDRSHATYLVGSIIASEMLNRLSARSIGSPYVDIASLLILLPLLAHFQRAQHMINTTCGDPDGISNSRFTKANYAWITLGLILWMLAFTGLFFPGD